MNSVDQATTVADRNDEDDDENVFFVYKSGPRREAPWMVPIGLNGNDLSLIHI